MKPLRLLGNLCAGVTLVLGLIGTAGWVGQEPAWRTLWNSGSEMKFNTALLLSAFGLSRLLSVGVPSSVRRVGFAGAIGVLGFSLLIHLEYLFDLNLGIDEWLYQDTSMLGTTHPGRMAWHTATVFSLLALGTLFLQRQKGSGQPAQWLALGALIFPLQAALGYVCGRMSIVGLSPSNAYMAMPTAVALTAGALSLLLQCPERGLMAPVTAPGHSGRVFRRLLLASALLPALIGFATLYWLGGHRHPPEYNVATVAWVTTILFVALTWFTAVRVSSAELALAQREQLYSHLVENLPDVVFRLDSNFRHLYISPAVEKLSGIPAQAFRGKTGREMGLPAPACDRFEEACRTALATRTEQAFEFEQNGRVLLTRIIPEIPPLGEGTLLGLTSDITERRRAEEALRESEQEFRAIFELAAAGASQVDPATGRFARVNATFCAITGFTEEELLRMTFIDLTHPEDRASEAARVAGLLRGEQQTWQSEKRYLRKDGTIRWVLVEGSVIRDEAGRPVRTIAIVHDLSDRIRAEMALQEARVRERTFVEHLPVGIWFVNAQGQIVYGNPAGKRIWAGAKHVGMDAFHEYKGWWHGTNRLIQANEWAAARALLQGETSLDEEIDIECFDGSRRTILNSAVPVKDSQGTILGAVVFNQDITERTRSEAALRDAQRELAEHATSLEKVVTERTARLQETVEELEAFSYSIAHDMRAPLRAMQGFAGVLTAEHADQLDQTAREYLQRIAASARRMDTLILDILNYSKVVRGELELRPIDPEQLIREILSSYPALQSSQADITVESPLPPLMANEAALTQVVSNLLGNAVKFVAPGVRPSVRIRATEENGWVRLWFEDNGIGIPPDSRARLFNIFTRLNRPDLYEGTGIGLAIVRKAAERMGGIVGVESEPGQGSRFWVQLKGAAGT